MILKQILLMASSLFFSLKRKTSDTQENITDMIRKSISAEVSSMSFKILVGFVLVSVIIYSVIQFGRALQILLSQVENGFVYELIAFGCIALISALSLYNLFNGRKEEEARKVEAALVHTGPGNLASEFAKGFLRGFESRPTQFVERNENIY